MSKLIATSRANPCLSCGDYKGRCRHQVEGEIILCMSANGARKGEVVDGGYKVVDFTKDGLWAILKLNNETQSDRQAQEWANIIRLRREQVKRQEKHSQVLPILQRDEQYRRIIAKLGLNQRHNSELKEHRGLTAEEIDFAVAFGFLCSWQRGKQISQVSPYLAGINPSGINRSLLGVWGLGIAALDQAGMVTGFQIKADNREKYAKYLWLSSASCGGNGPHLPSGELPVFVWRHPQAAAEQITETWLVEGGLKSLITALKLWFRCGRKDIQVIGAAGANWHGSLEAVTEALGLVSKVILCPDAGSLSNSHIQGHYRRIVDELTSKTYSVSIAWWGQLQKGIDQDIDELADIQGFDLVTPGEFFALASDINPEDKLCWAWRNWLKSRQYTPHMKVKLPKFRFPPQIPSKDAVIAVNSGLGSAKTEAMIELIRVSCNRGFLIGYRNNLLLQTGNRASDIGLKIYHLREDDGKDLVPDNTTHLALCLDSIHHVDGYFKGVDIYLDETVSILFHACGGGTLKDNQAKALAILSQALKECNRVILLDGNLADIHCEFIAKISGKQLFKIGNETQIPPHKFIFIDSIDVEGEIKKRDKSPLIKAMLADGVIPWVASDSKTLTDTLDEIFKQQGRLKGFVLNKDTAGEQWAKEFLKNPNKFIENHKPDYFIISPTAESGVNITVRGYFTDKFTFFSGVSGTNSQHQMLFRLRDDSIPHYVFCPEKSTVRDRNTPKNYSVQVYSKLLDEKILQSAMLAAEGNTSVMLEIIAKAISRNDDEWWHLSCQLGALDNFEMDHLRKCLIHALSSAGHLIEIKNWDSDDEIKKIENEAKESVRMRHALEIYQAVEYPTLEEANKIAKSNPDKHIQRRIEKTRLLDRLPMIQETDIWKPEFIADYYLKDPEFISKQQRFYFLKNFEISKKRSEVNWYYLATNQYFFMGQAKNDSHLKIWALQQLNILQFLDGEFYKESPRVIELVNRVRNDKDIANALGTQPNPETISHKERIEFIKQLLDIIGLKVGKPVQKIIDGVKQRIYTIDQSAFEASARLLVLEAIARKYDDYLQSQAVAKVNWEEQAFEEPQPQTEVETVTASVDQAWMPTPEELAAVKLQQVNHWSEVDLTQSELDAAWQLLKSEQQKRLQDLYEQYQQSLDTSQQSEVSDQPVQADTASDMEPSIVQRWKGLKLKLLQGLENAGSLYHELASKIGDAIGIADSEPIWNQYLNQWMVSVNFGNGCKSVVCDWLVALDP